MQTENNCNCPLIKVSLKLPLMIGGLVWAAATYFKKSSSNSIVQLPNNDSSSLIEDGLELFTEVPNGYFD